MSSDVGTAFAALEAELRGRAAAPGKRDARMPETMTASRVRIAVGQLLFTSGIEVEELYHALGIDPADAEPDALAHLAGVLDGMEAAARGIREQGLEGWSKPR